MVHLMKIYHVPGTRSVRPIWLCNELDVPVEVEQIDFTPEFRRSESWRAISPAGKVPALVDGDLRMFESGAMVNYILERYGAGRLHPAPGTVESALYHQWCWFAEATLVRPLGFYRILRANDEPAGTLVADAQQKFADGLGAVEQQLHGQAFLLGEEFSAADIMLGYSLAMVERLLNDSTPNALAYLKRLKARPAYQRVAQLG